MTKPCIAALEAEFNVILFEKKGRNVQLTKAGNVLLKHATYILNEVQATENKMHQIATDGGHIDIAYVSPLARNYVPRTVRAFLSKSQNKNVIFNFHQDITSKNVDTGHNMHQWQLSAYHRSQHGLCILCCRDAQQPPP